MSWIEETFGWERPVGPMVQMGWLVNDEVPGTIVQTLDGRFLCYSRQNQGGAAPCFTTRDLAAADRFMRGAP